jgi:hypothetical protein
MAARARGGAWHPEGTSVRRDRADDAAPNFTAVL